MVYDVEFRGGPKDGEVWQVDDAFNTAGEIEKTQEGYYRYDYTPPVRAFLWVPVARSPSAVSPE